MGNIDAGDLKNRIIIESYTETIDNHGQSIKSWGTFATLWARIESLSGRELEWAKQFVAMTTHKLTIYLNRSIDETMRVNFGGRYFDINGLQHDEEMKQKTTLFCTEVKVG